VTAPQVAAWLERDFTRSEKLRLGLEIAAAYSRARWLLWRTDLPSTVAALRSVTADDEGSSPHARQAGLRLGRVVERALRRLPFDSRCLMRSLVLLSLLAQRGIHSVLVIAVTPEPEFRAHAWVEGDAVPFLEPAGEPFSRIVEV
jgi:hypothetical protein